MLAQRIVDQKIVVAREVREKLRAEQDLLIRVWRQGVVDNRVVVDASHHHMIEEGAVETAASVDADMAPLYSAAVDPEVVLRPG